MRTLDLDQRTSMRVSRRSRRSSRHLASISVRVPRSSGIINSIKAFFHSRHKNADKDVDCPAEDIPPRSQNSVPASNQIPLDPFEEDDPDLKFGLGWGPSLSKLDDVSGKGATSHDCLHLESKNNSCSLIHIIMLRHFEPLVYSSQPTLKKRSLSLFNV